MNTQEKPRAKRQPKPKPPAMFINKSELAHHLTVDAETIEGWIADGTFPPPHSRPGERVHLWLRRHFERYVESGAWPAESFGRKGG